MNGESGGEHQSINHQLPEQQFFTDLWLFITSAVVEVIFKVIASRSIRARR
jgi:hypothetical protein